MHFCTDCTVSCLPSYTHRCCIYAQLAKQSSHLHKTVCELPNLFFGILQNSIPHFRILCNECVQTGCSPCYHIFLLWKPFVKICVAQIVTKMQTEQLLRKNHDLSEHSIIQQTKFRNTFSLQFYFFQDQ